MDEDGPVKPCPARGDALRATSTIQSKRQLFTPTQDTLGLELDLQTTSHEEYSVD